jgi:multisubunit Na+/H+ antiporter MnhE subunit
MVQSSGVRQIPLRAFAVAVSCMALEWILLVAGLKPHEMIVGAACVAAAGVFLFAAMHVSAQRIRLELRDLAQAWRLPGMMLSDAWTVTVVLLKDLLRLEPAGSFYRVSGFRTAKEDPLLVGRRVLATVYTTCTPNSIVIGIDPAQSRMLVHQVKRAPSSKLEKNLGSQS